MKNIFVIIVNVDTFWAIGTSISRFASIFWFGSISRSLSTITGVYLFVNTKTSFFTNIRVFLFVDVSIFSSFGVAKILQQNLYYLLSYTTLFYCIPNLLYLIILSHFITDQVFLLNKNS